jgi:riboflavin synthase
LSLENPGRDRAMFTGIIESIGTVRSVTPVEGGRMLSIRVPFKPVMGESIALSGACLTVSGLFKEGFSCFASSETLARSTLGSLKPGSNLHIERALPADGRMGGHIVSGHVDAMGEVVSRKPAGDAVALEIRIPAGLVKYMVEKGSVAVDGVSLTINTVKDDVFSVMVIPFTQKLTMLGKLKEGSRVNIEADMISKVVVRTVERLMGKETEEEKAGGVTEELLVKTGFMK